MSRVGHHQVIVHGKALFDDAVSRIAAARTPAELTAVATSVDTTVQQQLIPALGAAFQVSHQEVVLSLFLCQ